MGPDSGTSFMKENCSGVWQPDNNKINNNVKSCLSMIEDKKKHPSQFCSL